MTGIIDDFKAKHKDDSYPELIKVKAELMSEIVSYENTMKSGGFAEDRFEPVTKPYDNYMENLDNLISIIELMKEKCLFNTTMVDPDNTAEVINFYNEVIWNTSEHFVTNGMMLDAIEMVRDLAKKGVPEAMNDMGAMYYEGKFYEQSYKKAAYWYKKAADAGIAQAMSNLGYMYFYGQGVKQSYEKAYKFFSMAVLQEHPDGLNKLGDMYRNGIYVIQNFDIAMKCYLRANKVASKNKMSDAYPANLVRLAEMCMDGCLGWVNVIKANEMLLEAKEILEKQIENRGIYAKPVLERVNINLEKIAEMLTDS